MQFFDEETFPLQLEDQIPGGWSVRCQGIERTQFPYVQQPMVVFEYRIRLLVRTSKRFQFNRIINQVPNAMNQRVVLGTEEKTF